ncbi:MAG TPA: hypothetical protein DDZ74_01700 [Pseudomonas sp.]|nr:hypothetical protein [Pseudomonas sp.]
MKKIPPEQVVLRSIYDLYYDSYIHKKALDQLAEIFIEIDVSLVADALKVDRHLLFGYLRHLDRKYIIRSKPNVAEAHLFAIKVGNLRHAVDFPYLAAILSALELEHRRFNWTRGLSVLALIISLAALIVTATTGSDHGSHSIRIEQARIERAVILAPGVPKPDADLGVSRRVGTEDPNSP